MDTRAHAIHLNTERLALFDQQDALMQETRGRARSGEEERKLTRMDTRIDEIDAEVRDLVARGTREREADQLREAGAQWLGGGADRYIDRRHDAENEQLRTWLRGGSPPMDVNIRGAAYERELLRQGAGPAELRALAWDTGSVASGVPTAMARSLYETLELFTVMLRAPTNKLITPTGAQMKFPKTNAHGIATQVSGQGTTLAGTDPTFLSMTLDAFKYGQIVIVANEVLTDAAFDIASFLGRDVGRALGRVIDSAYTIGTGSGQPQGIMTAVGGAGTVVTGGSLITPTYEQLVNLVYSIPDAYRSNGSCGWLMADSTAGTLRKLRSDGGGTIGPVMWSPSITQGIAGAPQDTLLGYPVYSGAYVASIGSNARILGFGAFNAHYIRTVDTIMVDMDSSRYFDTDQKGVRARVRTDSDLEDATAWNILKMSV